MQDKTQQGQNNSHKWPIELDAKLLRKEWARIYSVGASPGPHPPAPPDMQPDLRLRDLKTKPPRKERAGGQRGCCWDPPARRFSNGFRGIPGSLRGNPLQERRGVGNPAGSQPLFTASLCDTAALPAKGPWVPGTVDPLSRSSSLQARTSHLVPLQAGSSSGLST